LFFRGLGNLPAINATMADFAGDAGAVSTGRVDCDGSPEGDFTLL
jgi:hypothetical protein